MMETALVHHFAEDDKQNDVCRRNLFPIGGSFATALQDWGYQTSAEATNATGQNTQNILNGDCEIAIAMQDVCMQAYGSGAEIYSKPTNES